MFWSPMDIARSIYFPIPAHGTTPEITPSLVDAVPPELLHQHAFLSFAELTLAVTNEKCVDVGYFDRQKDWQLPR